MNDHLDNDNPWASESAPPPPAPSSSKSPTPSSKSTASSSSATSHRPGSQSKSKPLPDVSGDDLLLVVFVHGFKGTDTTFADFPGRLKHVLSETVDRAKVECLVFPAYETKGELNQAVVRFSDWLTTLVVEKEVSHGTGAGSAKVILCGHSMGGLLVADSILEFVRTRPDAKGPLWPKIIACLAFDTPYLGVHPYVFKNSATKAAEHVNTARTVASGLFGSFAGLTAQRATRASQAFQPAAPEKMVTSGSDTATPDSPGLSSSSSSPKTGWAKWAPAAYAVGGGLLTAAAASAAYYNRSDIGVGYGWVNDHMKYVGTLWDEAALKKRVERLMEVERDESVLFRVFYTVIPPSAPAFQPSRTFVVLPPRAAPSYKYFLPAENGLALDEIQAHTGMFAGSTNDGFYDLGLQTAKFIREAVGIMRGRQLKS